MSKSKCVFVVVIFVVLMLLVPMNSAFTSEKSHFDNIYMAKKKQGISENKDIKIIDVYFDLTELIIEIQNNEETDEKVIAEFYWKTIPEGPITPELGGEEEVIIPAGVTEEVRLDFTDVEGGGNDLFEIFVYIGSEPGLLFYAENRYDEEYTLIQWYFFFGWECPIDEDLFVELTIDKESYKRNQPVGITISVTNTGDEDRIVVFSTSQMADFRIFKKIDNTGYLVYQHSYHHVYFPVETDCTIPAGETVELLNDKWDKTDNDEVEVEKGDYIIDGWMVSYAYNELVYPFNPETHDVSPVTINIKDDYGVELTCDDTYHNVAIFNSTTFIVKINNTGELPDTYDVAADSLEKINCLVNGVSAYTPYPITLAAGMSTIFEITAVIGDVWKGEEFVFVHAQSQNDTNVCDDLDLTVNIGYVVINEIYYNHTNTFEPSQWIEIHNPTENSIDISYYDLICGNEYSRPIFFRDTILDPYEYIVITHDVEAFNQKFVVPSGVRVFDDDEFFGKLVLTEIDTITLWLSFSDIELDSLSYGGGSRDAPGITNYGESIARYKGGYDTDNCKKDFYIERPPTPGAENSIAKWKPPKPSGPPSGNVGKEYEYWLVAPATPDGNAFYYLFNWGDGTDSGWTRLIAPGELVSASHIWTKKGYYEIKVKAKDTDGAESEWSDPLSVSMPKSKQLINLETGIYVDNAREMPFPITVFVGDTNIEVDAEGANKVEFYLDDEEQPRYTDDEEPYVWTWSEFSFGRHTLKVVAYDNAGNSDTDEMTVWKFF